MLFEFIDQTLMPYSVKCLRYVTENHTRKLVIVKALADVMVYISINWNTVVWCGRKPDWYLNSRLLSRKWLYIFLKAIRSCILLMLLKSAIGR